VRTTKDALIVTILGPEVEDLYRRKEGKENELYLLQWSKEK
jgi:hypothetical protein